MRAVVDSVRRIIPGSALAAPLVVGDAVVQVESGADFADPPTGGLPVLVAGSTLTYTARLRAEDYGSGVFVDTLVLKVVSPVAAAIYARVDVPGRVRYEAQVFVGPSLSTERADVPHNFINKYALRVLSGGLGTVVEVERRDDDEPWRITDIFEQDPVISATFLAPGTVPFTSLDAPLAAMVGGTGASVYRHTQTTPASSWTVVHNLGRKPAATIVLDTIGWVLTDLTYVDDNTLSIQFPSAVSGTADVV